MRWLCWFGCLFALLTVSTGDGSSAASTTWVTSQVEAPYVGYFSSLALNSSGLPSVAYFDGSPGYALKFATWRNRAWDIEEVPARGYYSNYVSLALDPGGFPCIAFNSSQPGGLACARRSITGWEVTMVDSTASITDDRALVLDSQGMPHIACRAPGGLWHVWHDGTAWQGELVDGEGDPGYPSSIGMDLLDLPHIAYYAGLPQDLRHAYFDGSTWQRETVQAEGNAGQFLSLAIDSRGTPHIGYTVGSLGGELWYAVRKHSGSWIRQMVDAAEDLGWHVSLDTDSRNLPHLVYQHWQEDYGYDLRYARWDGAFWQIERIPWHGSGPSLAIDRRGFPLFSYYRDTNPEGAQYVGLGRSSSSP